MSVGSLFEAVLQYPTYMCGTGEWGENKEIVSTYSDDEESICSEPPKEDGYNFFDWLVGAKYSDRNTLDNAFSTLMEVTPLDPSLGTPGDDGFFVSFLDGLVGARGGEGSKPNLLDDLFGSKVNSLGENVYRKTSLVNSQGKKSYVTLFEQKTLKGLKRVFSC